MKKVLISIVSVIAIIAILITGKNIGMNIK